jgi:uncharacterized protein
MWKGLAQTIIKFRLPLLLVILVITAIMGYFAQNVELSYDYVETVPATDPEMVYYKDFRKQFGEDGNLIAIGMRDSSLYQLEKFRKFDDFSEALSQVEGVKEIISLPLLQRLVKDTENKKFYLEPIFEPFPQNQSTLDSLFQEAEKIKFYSDQILNTKNGATLMLIFLDKDVINTSDRQGLISSIQALGEEFSSSTNINLHYAGLPFIRTVFNVKIREELKLFLILSVVITAFILWLFFRSWDAVVFPLVIICIMIVWSLGTMALLGYKMTILSGLIPPIIVIIGIPNCIYLLNKYHQEYSSHGDKMLALNYVTRKIGIVTLLTNFTTAIGFLVLATTKIVVLKEFGTVAGINILATFVVSIIIIPSVFSYLPAPNSRRLKHLKFKPLNATLTHLDLLVHRHKYTVFVIAAIVSLVSVLGLMKIKTVTYFVEDLPKESVEMHDLQFFESNFSGIMPLEIVIDTHKRKGLMRSQVLEKVDEFEDFLASQPPISEPISIVNFIKAARQAFYNNNPDYYDLPNQRDRSFILRYLQNSDFAIGMLGEGEEAQDTADPTNQFNLLSNFADTAGQKMRISLKVADIGSEKMEALINGKILPKIDEIFEGTETDAKVTGVSLLFIKGNRFLVNNLLVSMGLAFCVIAIIMGLLFGNFRMVIISLIPNIIPLLMTAGLMGYLGVALKPSTAIIFSIVFGISVDDSIHFLAKYRQELKSNNYFVPIAVSKSLRETGASMIYTSVVLFAGFIIFGGSSFGGTVYLGILTSFTLLVAMFTNLTVLPSLLLAFDSSKYYKQYHQQDFKPLIEHDSEFYQEAEDEEIDLSMISKRAGNHQPIDIEENKDKTDR